MAEAFIPALATASALEWSAIESTIQAALADRPAAIARQLTLFLSLLDLAARFRFGRSLAKLDLATRIQVLRWFERGPTLLLRRGIWGLRTLVMMGYYTQPGVIVGLGYRASPAGWSAR